MGSRQPARCRRYKRNSHFIAIVAGVDFGTLSVRVSIVDSEPLPAEGPAIGHVLPKLIQIARG